MLRLWDVSVVEWVRVWHIDGVVEWLSVLSIGWGLCLRDAGGVEVGVVRVVVELCERELCVGL